MVKTQKCIDIVNIKEYIIYEQFLAIRGGKTCTKDLLKKRLKSPNTTRI